MQINHVFSLQPTLFILNHQSKKYRVHILQTILLHKHIRDNINMEDSQDGERVNS